MTDDPNQLAHMLRDLYLRLENEQKVGSADHRLARALEDSLGTSPSDDDIDAAQSLLQRHGYK